MNEPWFTAILTLPAYLFPLVWSSIRNGPVASTFFFAYTFAASWLFSLFIAMGVLDQSSLIAPWVVRLDDIPWYPFALINIVVFATSNLSTKKNRFDRAIRLDRVGKAAWLTLGLAILYIAASVVAYGGLAQWVALSYSRAVLDDSTINYLSPLAVLTGVSSIVLYAISRRQKLNPKTKFAIIFNCALQLLVSTISGGRSVLLLYVVSLVIVQGKSHLPRWIRYSLLAGALIMASGLMIFARYNQQDAKASFSLNLDNIVSASYTGLPFIDHFTLSEAYTASEGHDFGSSYLNLVTLPIPRQLWPEKPIQLSRRMRQKFWGDSTGGIPPGYFGEAYIAFGWIGVFAAALILGSLLSHLTSRFPAKKGSSYQVAITAVTGSAIGFVLMRGGLDIGVYRVGLILVALWLVSKYVFFQPSPTQ